MNPNDSLILFSKNRLKEKCINSGSLTNTTKVGGFTVTCVVYNTFRRFPLIVAGGLTATASMIISFKMLVGTRFAWFSLTSLTTGIKRCNLFFVLADKKTMGA